MAGFFVDQAGSLKLLQQADAPNSGFRPGQLGAMYATLAHFSVQDDPAIICLPTGYGKTSLMMSLPLLLGATRILVVEPGPQRAAVDGRDAGRPQQTDRAVLRSPRRLQHEGLRAQQLE